jgi:branched-chain amino acid transport system permease protein
VTVGITISFGMLDIANIAQPAFILLGSYAAYIVNASFGLDPDPGRRVMLPVFYVLGMAVYQVYYYRSSLRGEQSIQGLAFFFGLLFVAEVALILVFGVDYRFVEAPYIGPSLHFGHSSTCPTHADPVRVSLAMIAALQLYLTRSFIGRAILAVSQDQAALQLMAANPTRIKRSPSASRSRPARLAGAFLIIIQPVEPSIGRDYIGRIFAICVLGGMTAFPAW